MGLALAERGSPRHLPPDPDRSPPWSWQRAVCVYLTATHLRLWRRSLLLVLLIGTTFVATMARVEWVLRGQVRRGAQGRQGRGRPHLRSARATPITSSGTPALWCGLGDFDHQVRLSVVGRRRLQLCVADPAATLRLRPPGIPPAHRRRMWDPLTFGSSTGTRTVATRGPLPGGARVHRRHLGTRSCATSRNDPLFLATDLRLGALRWVIAHGTPPTLGAGTPEGLRGRAIWGWLAVAAAIAPARAGGTGFELELIAFDAASRGTALLVYSHRGTVLYSIAHLVAIGIGAVLAWNAAGMRCLGWLASAARSLARRAAVEAPGLCWRAPGRLRETAAGVELSPWR